jgi:hypothetical protein
MADRSIEAVSKKGRERQQHNLAEDRTAMPVESGNQNIVHHLAA